MLMYDGMTGVSQMKYQMGESHITSASRRIKTSGIRQ